MTGMAGWLKQHPAEVQRLSRQIQILPATGSLVSLAAELSEDTNVTRLRDTRLSAESAGPASQAFFRHKPLPVELRWLWRKNALPA
jgi:hypothetical protein